MSKKNMLIGLALVVSVALWSPAAVLAGEHGGSEHGGTKMEGSKSHEHMEGSHGMTEDHAATLMEAAKVLRQEGHTDLAKKLEKMAKT